MPLVSVVVPTHNRPQMLAEALASVRVQTFTDYEVIVVSNGESPQMRALSRACAAQYGATIFELPEGNISAARNFAVAQAQGEWIAFLDDDDLWLPNKLERQLAAAHAAGADMVVCDCIFFYDDGREVISGSRVPGGWPFAKAINHGRWGAPTSAALVRKAAVDAAGGFDPGQRCCNDIDLWRRIAWRHAIHEMHDALVRYRQHAVTVSRQRRLIAYYGLRHYLKMLHDTPPDLRWSLPSPATLMRRWLLRTFMPTWLRHPRKQWASLRLRAAAQRLPGSGRSDDAL